MSSGFRGTRPVAGRQHLVVAQLGQSTRFGTGGSAVRIRPIRRAARNGTADIREWSSGRDARLWTERRWFDPIFPSTGEARSTPPHAAVAQSGERRLVTAEAAGSKPPVAPDPGGETDDHGRLRISSSGFESWPGCHLVVAQWDKSAALRRQRSLVRVQSTRPRRHSSVGRAQPWYG